MRSAKVYCALLLASFSLVGWSNATAEIFKGFPDVIVCKPGKGTDSPGELVFYVEGRGKSGAAVYKSIGRQTLGIKIGKDGIVQAETTAVNDCINQPLQKLQEQGRTLNFTTQ